MKYSVIPVAQSLILSCLNFNFFNVVISPGSRNVPLAIGFASNNNFKCFSIVDERSAAFFALGLSQRSKEPTILVCTSGSALLNYYPAIAEAYFSEIPLIILSADRPAYKLNIGDGQTINQNNVFEKNILYSKTLKQDCIHSTEEIIKSNKQEIIDVKSTASSILSKQKSIQNDNELIIEEAFNNCVNNNKPIHLNIPMEEPLYDFVNSPSIKINVTKKILFIDIKDCLENVFIFPEGFIKDNLETNKLNDVAIITAMKANKYNPRWGSLAKEWTLSIIPDLTINAPNRLKEKTVIERSIVQVLSWEDFIETLSECRKAVAANQGINATFSTGSQNQYPPQPNS